MQELTRRKPSPRSTQRFSPNLYEKQLKWVIKVLVWITSLWAIVLLLVHACISVPHRLDLPLQEDGHEEVNNSASFRFSLFGANEGARLVNKNKNSYMGSLRQLYESLYDPNDIVRIQNSVEDMRIVIPNIPKQLFECPQTPPSSAEYPRTWPLTQILKDWNPDNVTIPSFPSHLYHSLCFLDYNRHSPELIEAYRQAEIPFVLQNHPELLRAAERWNSYVQDQDDILPYLIALLRHEPPQRNEFASHSNHLPFWRGTGVDNPPTKNVKLTLPQWWKRAQLLENALRQNTSTVTQSDHYYFRFSATRTMHSYLYNELPIFKPDHHGKSSLFMVEPREERGINCRFGMVGTVADNHFDATRNWIVLLSGLRRYILSPPEQCQHLNLHPVDHISARHSKGSWAHPSSWAGLEQAMSLQLILQPGDALYLPNSWFHFIVSLTTTFQCNARSGTYPIYGSQLYRIFEKCGFGEIKEKGRHRAS